MQIKVKTKNELTTDNIHTFILFKNPNRFQAECACERNFPVELSIQQKERKDVDEKRFFAQH